MRNAGPLCVCGHTRFEHRGSVCQARHQDIPCGCKHWEFVGWGTKPEVKGDAVPAVTK